MTDPAATPPDPYSVIPGRPAWWSRKHIRPFQVDPDEADRIIQSGEMAAVSWVTAKAEPVTALLNYLFIDGHITITSTTNRSKYKAWSANPAACFCIWDPGDVEKQLTIRGQMEIFRTEEFHRRWIEGLIRKLSRRDDLPDAVLERQFRMFDAPDRMYMRLHISRIVSYDGKKMRRAEKEGIDVWDVTPEQAG